MVRRGNRGEEPLIAFMGKMETTRDWQTNQSILHCMPPFLTEGPSHYRRSVYNIKGGGPDHKIHNSFFKTIYTYIFAS